jgi:hypothetical protein
LFVQFAATSQCAYCSASTRVTAAPMGKDWYAVRLGFGLPYLLQYPGYISAVEKGLCNEWGEQPAHLPEHHKWTLTTKRVLVSSTEALSLQVIMCRDAASLYMHTTSEEAGHECQCPALNAGEAMSLKPQPRPTSGTSHMPGTSKYRSPPTLSNAFEPSSALEFQGVI